MKKVIHAAAIAAIAAVSAVIAGCATPQASVGAADASTARAAAYYCVQDNLLPQGDGLRCNWQRSADEACKFGDSSTLQRGTLAGEPQRAGRCNSGQWLVRATPR